MRPQPLPLILILLVSAAFGQTPTRLADYALVLEDTPVARKVESRAALHGPAAQAHLQRIRTAQSGVLAELARRNVKVISTEQTLLNAVFVKATREEAAQLIGMPGVVRVVHPPRYKPALDKAVGLVNIPVGGVPNGGAGVRIGIVDSGIDQNHPGFQDSSLKPPSGFPQGDANYTNNKVIVARSYVALDAAVYDTPDDYSPRDHMGHGTAIAMIAAGVQNTGPAATIQGVAPKAFLGNYKIFGSPGVNDYTYAAVLVAALTNAVDDGMDVVTLSMSEGDPATYSPLDVDPSCAGSNGDTHCDVLVEAVENAVTLGMVVVTAAGNDGSTAANYPTLNSIHTPGTAPSAITVGASMNSHVFYQAVHVSGPGAPSNLQNIRALFGDGPQVPPPPAPVRDVTQLQNDGLACSALPAGSLAGAIALIQRGTCLYSNKVINAQNAGAVGVILYRESGSDTPLSVFAQDAGIPAVMIGNTDGAALKNYLAANPGATVTLDLTFTPVSAATNTVWPSSSRGPSIGNFGSTPTFVIKPELVAPGADLYTAAQTLDPNGDAYNATGYTSVTGTSYAVPMVAGAVALVKQNHSAWTPAQLKSAVVNTATQDVTDGGVTARANAVGAGKLSVGDAVNVAATLDPATLSFGAITSTTVNSSLALKITNVDSSTATFGLQVQPRDTSSATVAISQPSVTLGPNASSTLTVSLKGSRPSPGSYEGFIVITGAGPTLRVPYLYFVGDGVPYNIFPVSSGSFTTAVSTLQSCCLGFEMVDQYGVPVTAQAPVFNVVKGGGSIDVADSATDRAGMAFAIVNIGPQPGDQIFTATAGGLSVEFDGYALPLPAINSNGVVNTGSFQVGRGLAPGSYISIFGASLADAVVGTPTLSLPVSVGTVSVSFDGGGLSLPGHIHFVSPGQVDVQIPWEFQGQSSVAMTVSEGYIASAVYTVPLNTYSPGIFEFNDNGHLSAAATDNNGVVFTQANPAKRGQTIVLYVNGLGPVDQQEFSGEPTPLPPPLANTGTATVTIGNIAAHVDFSGLSPGWVGLYQVNVDVPSNAPTGLQPIMVSIGGVDSKASVLPVE
jgi:minor extracellular serine protease Vpr